MYNPSSFKLEASLKSNLKLTAHTPSRMILHRNDPEKELTQHTMTRRHYPRSATLPPIKDPIVENDEDHDSDGENTHHVPSGHIVLGFIP